MSNHGEYHVFSRKPGLTLLFSPFQAAHNQGWFTFLWQFYLTLHLCFGTLYQTNSHLPSLSICGKNEL